MRNIALILSTILLQVAISALESPEKWVELTHETMEDAILANEWTCVLLYDPWDERGLYEHTLVMEGIYDKMLQRDRDQ